MIKPIASSYWRLIKAGRKVFAEVPASVKEDVIALAKIDLMSGEISLELYRELIDSEQAS